MLSPAGVAQAAMAVVSISNRRRAFTHPRLHRWHNLLMHPLEFIADEIETGHRGRKRKEEI